jgi:hypothetical protein
MGPDPRGQWRFSAEILGFLTEKDPLFASDPAMARLTMLIIKLVKTISVPKMISVTAGIGMRRLSVRKAGRSLLHSKRKCRSA